ncbi:hypothetical protein [Quatrionicoccus australiensis]|uniref:hypothetical protein n=1 Tax=Quatrionicoccus australiensis TaxID=138118 RepID=UPI001CF9D044|nr:hypothetical protein [Quatrionicoccus australiensis]MCB4360474.1 hypothetical protein [Quatrionicoccus australiensis]
MAIQTLKKTEISAVAGGTSLSLEVLGISLGLTLGLALGSLLTPVVGLVGSLVSGVTGLAGDLLSSLKLSIKL